MCRLLLRKGLLLKYLLSKLLILVMFSRLRKISPKHIVIRLTHETPIIILFVEDINISHLTNIFNRNKNEEKKEFNELLILNNSIKFVIEEIRKT